MKSENPSYERYQRQTILKGLGEAGQQKLLQAKVLVIGAGGLGCPALQYLAAAGVGNIGIVDDDIVSLSNLHRQPLYNSFDIGFSKVEKAKHHLTRLNPDIHIDVYNERLSTKNALAIFEGYDIIIDGTDNFSTRYLVNDACVLLHKPLVYGAVSQFEGQLAVFNHQQTTDITPVNYRDLFPQAPAEGEVLNCAEAGVLGVLPGIIGTMQANETIKLITGVGKPLTDALLTFNTLNNQFYEIALTPLENTRSMIPATAAEFAAMDYDWFCGIASNRFEMSAADFDELKNDPAVQIIDVREAGEVPTEFDFNYTSMPMSGFKERMNDIDGFTIILFCQSGKRSLQAAQWLFDSFGDSKKIYSLQGGIVNWINSHTTAS